jgi:menaquinol-cytochrome c reductase iron-sulfur subunit
VTQTERKSEPSVILQLRRDLLAGFSVLLGLAGAALIGAPVIGFLLAPFVRGKPRVWRAVGRVDQFKIGDTVQVTFENANPLPWDGFLRNTSAWLRQESQGHFVAYSINCTHLGCPVRWEPGAQLFLCPCHGGVYSRDGQVAAGPPPRALVQYPVRVQNGLVEIQTTPIPLV